MASKPCRLLDKKSTATLLLGIGCGREVCITAMQEFIPNYKTLKNCVNSLESEGLLEIKYVFDPRPSIRLKLTTKGEAVAMHLKACADIINGVIKIE